jgi:hypothetical protein
MDNVRLTVTIRNQRNSKRVQLHKDIELKDAERTAATLTKDAAKFFRKEKAEPTEE